MEKEWNNSLWQRISTGDIKSVVYRLKKNKEENGNEDFVNQQDPFGRSGLFFNYLLLININFHFYQHECMKNNFYN